MHRDTYSKSQWDVVIAPRKNVFYLDFAEIWRYRDLILMFFKRDFVALQADNSWPIMALIQPLMTAATYFVVFGKIVNLSTAGLPPLLFYMSGIVLWNYFSACLINNSEVFSKNAALFGKVYFPRLVVPISISLSGLVAFVIQFLLLMVITLTFVLFTNTATFHPIVALALPFIVIHVAALGMGVGLLSALTVRFRDLVFVAGFATQLWMYATPAVYPFRRFLKDFSGFTTSTPAAPIEMLRSSMFAPAIS